MIVIFLVLEENTYLSRIVEVQKKRHHKVITTGPYSFVRHPMYLAAIILFFCTALALGSYCALAPAAIVSIFIIIQTMLEEKMLKKELPGYKQYIKDVRYRLVPGLW